MSHTHLPKGLLLGKKFKKNFPKSLQKKFKFKKKNLYHYVKVCVKNFKIYVNFKSFEIYL
jgi:hypothetical protein